VTEVPSVEEKWSARLKTTFGGLAQRRAGVNPTRHNNKPCMARESFFKLAP